MLPLCKWPGRGIMTLLPCDTKKRILFQRMFGSCLGYSRNKTNTLSITAFFKTLQHCHQHLKALQNCCHCPRDPQGETLKVLWQCLQGFQGLYRYLWLAPRMWRPDSFQETDPHYAVFCRSPPPCIPHGVEVLPKLPAVSTVVLWYYEVIPPQT